MLSGGFLKFKFDLESIINRTSYEMVVNVYIPLLDIIFAISLFLRSGLLTTHCVFCRLKAFRFRFEFILNDSSLWLPSLCLFEQAFKRNERSQD